MPRKVAELSALAVKRLRHPGHAHNATFAVGGVSGLLLQITPGGARSWVLRTTVGTKRRHIGLGAFPDVSLGQARERAREARDDIHRGIDPIERRKAATAALRAAQKRGLLFRDAVEKYLETKLGEFRNEKHRRQWRSTLDTHAEPVLGDMLVGEIRVSDVARALEPLWSTRTETASRLRGRIENVLAWATVAGHRDGDNPARWRGNLDAILPKPGKVATAGNWPAVALADAPAWFAALRSREGTAAKALEFLTLAAARSGEVRGATWAEIDLEARLWIISATRMKAGKEHRVPLTGAMVALLEAVPRTDSPHIFPAVRGGMLSDMSISAVMRRMQESEIKAKRKGWLDPRSGRPAVPHGLRSSFRDWSAERTSYPGEMAEIALAHTVGSEVERAYRRSDLLEKRRQMMRDWSAFLLGETAGKVVPLRAKK